jgi:hypothetical protein
MTLLLQILDMSFRKCCRFSIFFAVERASERIIFSLFNLIDHSHLSSNTSITYGVERGHMVFEIDIIKCTLLTTLATWN